MIPRDTSNVAAILLLVGTGTMLFGLCWLIGAIVHWAGDIFTRAMGWQ